MSRPQLYGRASRRDERGSVAVEAALGVPALGMFVALIIMGGRIAIAHQAVDSAAFDAARAASIARTQADAVTAAKAAANQTLDQQGLQCANTQVDVNAAAFNAPLGTSGTVTVTVTCAVKVGGLGVPGVSGPRKVSETASSPIDAYRERR